MGGVRIAGEERETLGKELADRYHAGEPIRALAAATGRSYGFVHGLLAEEGVHFRAPGRRGERRADAVLRYLGAAIRNQRKAVRLSQKDLSARVAINQPHICDIENGHYLPSLMMLHRLAAGLDTQAWVLLRDADRLAELSQACP